MVQDLYSEEGGGGPAVMIGDSITDLATAQAAGVPCILMSYGYTPVPARDLGADLVLDEFAAIARGAEKNDAAIIPRRFCYSPKGQAWSTPWRWSAPAG